MVSLLPLLAACVAGVFATQLGRDFARRRRGPALAWSLSLALFAAASAAVTLGVTLGWSRAVFAVYWIAGAHLNVPLLAAGQLLLLDPRRRTLWWGLAVLAAVVSVAVTALAPFDAAALQDATRRQTIPLGRDVLGGTAAYALVTPLNATFLVVVAGSVWSAVRHRRWAVLLIAVGVTIAAAASSAVGAGRDELFALLLAAGISTMYAGFVAAGRLPASRGTQPTTPAAGPNAP